MSVGCDCNVTALSHILKYILTVGLGSIQAPTFTPMLLCLIQKVFIFYYYYNYTTALSLIWSSIQVPEVKIPFIFKIFKQKMND